MYKIEVTEESGSKKIESDSRGKENEKWWLIQDIKRMTDKPRSSTGCRICKVPSEIRKWNEEAYTPKIVSIGPLHHRNRRFLAMEEIKVRYFKSYLERTEKSVDELVTSIRAQEGIIRSCYVDQPISLDSDDFVKMILFDASFILEFFIKHNPGMSDEHNPGMSDDRVLGPPGMSDNRVLGPAWVHDVFRDLVLLENQLPIFVIEKLFYFAPPIRPHLSFMEIIERACSPRNFLNNPKIDEIERVFIENARGKIESLLSNREIEHLTDLLRIAHISQNTGESNKRVSYGKLRYSATQLHEAGLKFRKSSSDCLVDLKFNDNVLEVATIDLTNGMETIIRNIIALEQVRYMGEEYITDYFLNLSSLINTTKDLDLLCDKGIIVSQVDDSSRAISSIKNLCNGPIYAFASQSRYNSIINNLNEYYERPWRTQMFKWKNTLINDYFSNPWRSLATIAAIILLVLTFIQTVYSVIK